MISFRYHIVSIVSVFLALAVGVALGGGPLRGEVDNTLVQQVQADRRTKADLRARVAALSSANDFTDEYARQTASTVVGGRLQNRPVTFLVLPDAGESVVGNLGELVETAGGSVAGTVRLGEELLDGVNDVTVPEGEGTYERLGALLARAVATDEDAGAPVDDAANSILSGLSTADLLSPSEDLERRGSLVLVVGGDGPRDADRRESAAAVVSSMAEAVDQASDGVVVTGPVAAASDGGVVEAVRGEVVTARDVSTVDTIERAAGQVVAVMALAEQAAGEAGHYGSVDAADGVMPGTDGEG